jgi:hypothetical protein
MAVLKMVKDSLNGVAYVKLLKIEDEYIELDKTNYNRISESFEIILAYLLIQDNKEAKDLAGLKIKFETGDFDINGNYRMNKDYAKEISEFLYKYFSSAEFMLAGGYPEIYLSVCSLRDVCS